MGYFDASVTRLRAAAGVIATVLAAVVAGLAAPAVPAFAAGSTTTSTTTPTTSTTTPTTNPPGTGTSASSAGYWLAGGDGNVYALGTTNYGGLKGVSLNKPVVGGSPTADGLGYWLVASDGGIFSFGDARFYGSTGNITLNKPIVGMAVDPATGGYWMVASDGGVFSYNAPFYGSTGAIRLNKPVVGMAVTPDGGGYWLVASDGGIFAFGDARFYGSTGNIALARPIVGMAAMPDGDGYWMVASDGGIFAFGSAGFYGSHGGTANAAPFVSMASTPDGKGYWLVDADGGVFTYGDAPFLGTAGTPSAPVVAVLATRIGYPFPPGGTGYDISQYQCPDYPYHTASLPTAAQAVSVIQASGGAINKSQPSGCYQQEAQWAGPNVSSYIFMNELPSPAPSESMTGPAGSCSPTQVVCQSYNFGYYWARHWVSYSRNLGVASTLWWLDVEQDNPFWNGQSTTSNANVISGAVAGLRSMGVLPGIYSTAVQWGQITGNQLSFPNIPLWVPGAGNISGGTYSAQNFCAGTVPGNYGWEYAPFAGGKIVLVQYGYGGNGYTGPASQYDQDYACTQ